MKKILFLFLFLLKSLLVSGQWQIVPNTEGAQVTTLILSDNYLFACRYDVDTSFIRIDLNNFNRSIMSLPSRPFTMYGFKKLGASGANILYTDQDTTFLSQNYGQSWARVNSLLPETGMYILSGNDSFYFGGFRKLSKSFDAGSTFSSIYYENLSTNTTIKPLLIKDGYVYFSDQVGLIKINYLTGVYTILDTNPNRFQTMVLSGDTLIGGSLTGIYHSYDNGTTWTLVNPNAFNGNYIQDLLLQDTMLLAAVNNVAAQISFDNGRTFFAINDGLPAGTIVSKFSKDSLFFYAATLYGAYRRPISDFVIRNINGQVYYDMNQNNTPDINESGLPYQNLVLDIHHNNYLTDSAGFFNITYVGVADSLRYTSPHSHYISNPAAWDAGMSIQSRDFAIQIDSTIDCAGIAVSPLTNARPGMETTFSIDCSNYGSGHRQLNVLFKPDTNYTFVSISDSASLITTTDSILWLVNFAPFERKQFTVRCSLPPNLNLVSDTIYSAGTISPYAQDNEPADNFDTIPQIVSLSYDPNYKQVIPSGDIHPDFISNDYFLNYLICFQNTGTDTAFNILVSDTLDPLLDQSSFEFIGSSHYCNINIDTNNAVSFQFNNINLPDSTTNEPASHGYVRFRIRPVNGIVDGNVINNFASIFFDINTPVFTDTVQTQFTNSSASAITNWGKSGEFRFYPNPVSGTAIIEFNNELQGNCSIEIFNLAGELVIIPQSKNEHLYQLDLSLLPPGMYFFIINGEGGFLSSGKFIVN